MERRKSDSGELSGETLSSPPACYVCSPSIPARENCLEDGDWPQSRLTNMRSKPKTMSSTPSRPGYVKMDKDGFETVVNGRDHNVKWDEESMLSRLLALYDNPSKDPEQDPVDPTGEEDGTVHQISRSEDAVSDSGTVEIHLVSSPLMPPSRDQGEVDYWQDKTRVHLTRTDKTQPQKSKSKLTGGLRSSPKTPAELRCSPRPKASQVRKEVVKAQTLPRYTASPVLPSPAKAGSTLSKHQNGRKSTRSKTPWKSSSLEDFQPLRSKIATISNRQRQNATQVVSSVLPTQKPTISLRRPSESASHNNPLETRSPNVVGVGTSCKPFISKRDKTHTEPDRSLQRIPIRVGNESWLMPAGEYAEFLAWMKYRKVSCEINDIGPPTPDNSAAFFEEMGSLEASCENHRCSRFDENSLVPRAPRLYGRESHFTKNDEESHAHQFNYAGPQQHYMCNEFPPFDENLLESRTRFFSGGKSRCEENACGPDIHPNHFSDSIHDDVSIQSPSFDENLLVPRARLFCCREPRHEENTGFSKVRQVYESNALQNQNTIGSLSHDEDPLDRRTPSLSGWDSSNRATITPSRVRHFQYLNIHQNPDPTDYKASLHNDEQPPTKTIVSSPLTRSPESSKRETSDGPATRLLSDIISPRSSPKLWLDSRFPSSKYFADSSIGSRLVSVAELSGPEINIFDLPCAVQFPVFEIVEGLSPEHAGIIPRLNMEIFSILGGKDFGLRMAMDVVVGITPRILIIDRRDMDLQFSIVDQHLATSKAAEWRVDSDGDYALFKSEKMSEGQVIKVELYWTTKMGGSFVELPVVAHQVVLGGEIWCEVDDATILLQMDDGKEMDYCFSKKRRNIFLPTLKPRHGMSISIEEPQLIDTTSTQDKVKDPVTASNSIDTPPMLEEVEDHTHSLEVINSLKPSTFINPFPSLRALLNATIMGFLIGVSFHLFQNWDMPLDIYNKALTTPSEYPLTRQDVALRIKGVGQREGFAVGNVDVVRGRELDGDKGVREDGEEDGFSGWFDRALRWRGA